jgi:hypothetical protein
MHLNDLQTTSKPLWLPFLEETNWHFPELLLFLGTKAIVGSNMDPGMEMAAAVGLVVAG